MKRFFRLFDFPSHFWFTHLMGHHKRFKTVVRMRRYLWVLVALGMAISIALALFLTFVVEDSESSLELLMTTLFLIGSGLVSINLYTSFLPEFAVLWQSHSLISDETLSDRLDLLRLGIGEQDIVRVMYGFAQVKSWGMMGFWLSGRVLFVLIFWLVAFLFMPSIQREAFIDQTALFWVLLIYALPFALVVTVAFPLELVWRWRLVCAVSIYASARSTSRMYGLFMGFLMLMGISLVLSTLLFIVSIPLLIGVSGLIFTVEVVSLSEMGWLLLVFLVLIPLMVVLFVWGLYKSYAVLTSWLLNNTERYLLRQ